MLMKMGPSPQRTRMHTRARTRPHDAPTCARTRTHAHAHKTFMHRVPINWAGAIQPQLEPHPCQPQAFGQPQPQPQGNPPAQPQPKPEGQQEGGQLQRRTTPPLWLVRAGEGHAPRTRKYASCCACLPTNKNIRRSSETFVCWEVTSP